MRGKFVLMRRGARKRKESEGKRRMIRGNGKRERRMKKEDKTEWGKGKRK